MKKLTCGKLILAYCAVLFLFTGCENFLKGQAVKDEIEKTIDYNNAPAYIINVDVLSDNDGVIKSATTLSKKVTDTFTVKFAPKSGHTFQKWEAVIPEIKEGEKPSDYIEFDDEYSLETEVTFKKAGDGITIRPVCPENLTVSFKPGDSTAVYPRDTTIQLLFNKPVAAGCEDKIEIKIPELPADKTARSYFRAPLVEGSTISFFADVTEADYSNLIPVGNSGKVVSVVLKAGDFYYENTTDYNEPVKMYLDNDIIFSYTISSETSKLTEIKYTLDDETAAVGTYRIDDEGVLGGTSKKYSIRNTINLKYTLKDYMDYTFSGWAFAYAPSAEEAAQSVSADELESLNIGISYAEDTKSTFGYDSLTHTAQAELTVYNYKEGIISVSPVVSKIKKTSIKTIDTNTEAGELKINGAAADENAKEYRPSETLLIKYKLNKADDYKFGGWSITRKASGVADKNFTLADFINTNLAAFNVSVSYEDNAETFGCDSLSRTAQVLVTVDSYIEGELTISPVVFAIDKTQIKTFTANTEAGELKINGAAADEYSANYNPGQSFTLKYKLKQPEDYRFTGWSVSRVVGEAKEEYAGTAFTEANLKKFNLKVTYEDNAATYGYESLSNLAQMTVTVEDYIEGLITISPVISAIPKTTIYIEGANGKLSPAKGDHIARLNGEAYPISFEPDGDYEFVYWQVYNANVGKTTPFQYEQYLDFDTTKSDTTYKLLQEIPSGVKIGICAQYTERPKIISATPSYVAEGAFRDARIQVMFDQNMDPNSIYYIQNDEVDEVQDLLDSGVAESDLLKTTVNGAERVYGYKLSGDIVYKNITIVHNKNYSNLLEYFDAPRFDDPRKLSIPTKKGHEPPSGTALLVTLSNNFCRSYSGNSITKDITMRESHKWVYFVNSQIDNNGPIIDYQKTTVRDSTETPINITTNSYTNPSFLNKDKKIQLRLKATDEGSGPSDKFDIKVYNVDDGDVAVTGENATYSKAKDQNAKDKADQDARIAQSDVMHKGYDASKLTK